MNLESQQENLQTKDDEGRIFIYPEPGNKLKHRGDEKNDGGLTSPNHVKINIQDPVPNAQVKNSFSLENKKFSMGIPRILRILFMDITLIMTLISKNVIKKGQPMELHHLPNLDEGQKVENKYIQLEQQLERIASGQPISGKHIFQMVKFVFKKQFLVAHVLIFSGIAIKSFNSIVIQKIISTYSQDGAQAALGWTFLLIGMLFVGIVINNQSFMRVQNMSTEIRLNLIAFLYSKASKFTNFQIQTSNVGKLFNLVSFDLAVIEMMLYFGFMIFYIPILLLISAAVLYSRFGGYGLISILIVIFIIPLQLFMGLSQKSYMNKKNKYSDERIKLVSESVDGIRLMKMYAWEEAFCKFVSIVRNKELQTIGGIQLFRASDRAFSISFVLTAAFIPILIMYANGSEEITSSRIYATLEQLYGLRSSLFLTGVGIAFLFQIGLILERISDFLKLKKQPITSLSENAKYDSVLAIKQKELKKKLEGLTKQKQKFLKNNPRSKNLSQFSLEKDEQALLNISNHKFNQTPITIGEPLKPENLVEFENFNLFWDAESNPTLKDITLEIQKGKQYALVGKVGVGKTSFLQVILDEAPHMQGVLRKKGSLSFVEQEPYVFSGKFKDNILFGKDYEEEFYKEVIQACCLEEDLQQLPNGDETEIGEKGINLSGGQKARLSLARAVYSRSDIYLLDDPLSAVDSKVARKLYQNCINGILKDKTVILSTHQIHFTKSCDEILILNDGTITHRGKFNQLEKILLEMANQQTFGDDKVRKSQSSLNKEAEEGMPVTENTEPKKDNQSALALSKGKLFTLEKEEKFQLSFNTYKNYFGYVGNWPKIYFVLLLYVISEGFYTGFYYSFGSYDSEKDRWSLFWKSGILLACFILICLSKYLMTVKITGIANSNLHHQMFTSVSRSPVLYFDQTPSGRILNKFSNDLGAADMMLPFMLFDSIEGPLQFFNICITVGILNPWFFLLAAVLLITCYNYMQYSKVLIVQAKQLDLMFKSPVFSFFTQTIQGVIHIRIYNQLNNFTKQLFKKANDSIRTNFTVWRFNRGFSFNQQILTMIFSLSGIILALYTSSSANMLGQSIVYLTMLIEVVYALSRQLPNLDSNMTSVERVLQLCSLEQEDKFVYPSDKDLYNNSVKKEIHDQCLTAGPLVSGQTEHSLKNEQTQLMKDITLKNSSWVKEGSITFENVKLKYREDLDLVLKGTSFKIKGGHRVGCVGRTGAGKSSLLQALFRMTKLEIGSKILIDEINIQTIGLHTLRSAISIIPQVPFVFSGTIRRNLDPLEEYSDEQIWKSLQQTNLDETIKKLPNNILTDMSNVQSIFSTGQKQLICLARAILKNSKILVLDEATANVDMRTDEFIQDAIKQSFKNSTIFTIAHRLNTIADYDKVIVMDKGIVAEQNSPYLLLVEKIGDTSITSKSIFAQMVKNTGNDNALAILQTAQKKYEMDQDKSEV